jgi:hypothetical protein
MELVDSILTTQQVHDLDILIKSLKHLRTFFLLNENKKNYLLNGCVVDKTYRVFERCWTPAALCIALARTTFPSLVKLPNSSLQHEYPSVLEVKTRLNKHGFTLRLEDLSAVCLSRKYVLEAGTFTWILEPRYGQ